MGTDKQEDMQTAIPSMQMSSLNLTYQEEISQPGCKKKKKITQETSIKACKHHIL